MKFQSPCFVSLREISALKKHLLVCVSYFANILCLQNILSSLAKHTEAAYKINAPAPLSFQVVIRISECSAFSISGIFKLPCLSNANLCPFDVLYGTSKPSFCLAIILTYKSCLHETKERKKQTQCLVYSILGNNTLAIDFLIVSMVMQQQFTISPANPA